MVPAGFAAIPPAEVRAIAWFLAGNEEAHADRRRPGWTATTQGRGGGRWQAGSSPSRAIRSSPLKVEMRLREAAERIEPECQAVPPVDATSPVIACTAIAYPAAPNPAMTAVAVLEMREW